MITVTGTSIFHSSTSYNQPFKLISDKGKGAILPCNALFKCWKTMVKGLHVTKA